MSLCICKRANWQSVSIRKQRIGRASPKRIDCFSDGHRPSANWKPACVSSRRPRKDWGTRSTVNRLPPGASTRVSCSAPTSLSLLIDAEAALCQRRLMIHVPARRPLTRREALCKMGAGFGMLSFASLIANTFAHGETPAAAPWMIQDPKFKPKAKHVIFLFMNGGLSQVDSFDPKPMLEKYDGKPLPGETPQHERKTGGLMKSPFTFKKCGKSGIEVSELFPHLGESIDDICVVRSVYTEIPNHEPALIMMNTGANVAGRPSMGSWITYGLGTENKNLPSFVVLCPDVPTTVGPPLWNSAFLPPMYQGTYVTDDVRSKEFDPQKLIPNIHNEQFDLKQQNKELELLTDLDRLSMENSGSSHDPQLEATISALETAYRMQTEAPEVFDVRKESDAVQKLYGEGSTARGCMTAARLIERGVRTVQVYYAKGDPWDHHFDIQLHRKAAHDSDQPFAALIKDLKSRGLFEETLIVCGSEFGRTPVVRS